MDWLKDVAERVRRKNQILFSKDNYLIQEFDSLIRLQSHRTLILWALNLAEETVITLEQKYPADTRPRNALEITKLWAAGNVKMPIAKCEILHCHAMAKDLIDLADIALCHAIGQACGVVHTPGHALGYPIYELTSFVRKFDVEGCRNIVEARFNVYVEKLLYWAAHEDEYAGTWAPFLK